MSGGKMAPPWLHDDEALFLECLNYTAAETGFSARLIEKDYFCSLVLDHLQANDSALIFKGGTCLSKVYAGFYRLSEDLDFVISVPLASSRSDRSRLAAAVKQSVADLPASLQAFSIAEPMNGANNSTQYLGTVAYPSLVSQQREIIKIEIGLREPLLTPHQVGSAASILLNPISRKSMIMPVALPCISMREAFAEKFRAALSRREVAIRDFFDIDHAVGNLGLQTGDGTFVELVRAKLAIPGNEPVDVSAQRLGGLRRQLDTQLKPVLREQDFRTFDLERAIQIVVDIAQRISADS